ncbi:MAG: ribonuclease P protein component [Alphaproteobacteria bacterium]
MGLEVRRLKRRREFLRVAAARRKWVAPGLILQAAPVEAGSLGAGSPDAVGVGFTVSRKVGNAVKRNRAKRRLRAAAGEVLRDQARPGVDLVLIGRGATLDRPYADLVGDLRTALRRLGVLRPVEKTGEGGSCG